jgi:ABC-type Fe3+/spermidine/putrescine transport system ATPase subunit
MTDAQAKSKDKGLRVERLAKQFVGTRAVNDVSFVVNPGEFVSLLGPSGCGKTTTLRCIAGFERPTSGRVLLDGQVLTDPANNVFVPPNRRRFGMVFQSYAVWPHMTVEQNVGYPLMVNGGYAKADIRARARATLKMVGLAGVEERYPTQLSGGQQQRVALARAVVMEPLALLFDEPLSNLDAKLRERMRFELVEIQSALGVPALYVTHDQTEAMVMSKTVIVMEGGAVAQSGTPEEIYDRPANRFVADFIGNCNLLDADVTAVVRAGRFNVKGAFGAVECVGDESLGPGDAVLLVIRPERIQIQPMRPEANALQAVVRHQYFMGSHREYVLEIGDTTVRVQTNAMQIVAPGERVMVAIAVGDCKLIRAST